MAIEDAGLNPKDFPVEDFQSETKSVVTTVNKLVSTNGVNVVVGPEWTEFSEVALSIAKEKKIIIISPWMSGEYEWVKSPYFFSMTPSDRSTVKLSLEHIKKSGKKNIALIYNNNTWSVGIANIVKNELDNNFKDLNLVVDIKPVANNSDYRSDILKIKDSKTDAIFAIIDGSSNPDAFARQLKELKVNLPTYIPPADVDVIKANKKRSESGNGLYYAVIKDYDKTKEFNQKYKNRFGKEPVSLSAATTYDITTILLKAMKNGVKSTDVSKYLHNIKDYVGYSGIINFNDMGMVISGPVELRQIEGDSYKVIQ